MAEDKIIKIEENLNNQSENVQSDKAELSVDSQKDTQQFLQQIDNIVNIPTKSNSQIKQINVSEKDTNTFTNQNSSNTTDNSVNELKVRVVKKFTLDGDVNASLRNPMSDTSQVRVVEKNNLETDVIASLRDPVVDYRGTEEIKTFSAIPEQAPIIIKPNMTISSSVVEEGTKAIFSVNFDKALNKPFQVTFNTSTNGSAQPEDINPLFIVKDSKGNEIPKNANGSYTVPAGETNLKVEVQTRNDKTFEGNETFELNGKTEFMNSNIQGTGTIKDDGSLSNGLNDDRPLTVNSISINENSPYGVFTVGGVTGQLVKLNLTDGTATVGTDTSGVQFEYFNGTSWVYYPQNSYVAIPSGNALLVRVAITKDSVYEGAETFNLVATNTGGGNASGVGTIHDDGTGQWFDGTSGTGSNTAPAGQVLDDDRLLSINNISVNEGSPYAVFTVSGAANQKATLDLVDGTTTNTMGSNSLQYWTGSDWTAYTSGATVTLNTNGKLLVRTSLIPEQESAQDNGETFRLIATNTGGTNTPADEGIATIYDNGTGTYFPDTNPTDNNTPATDSGATLDNDGLLSVNSISINEGSPYAVFTVSGTANQLVSLGLSNGTTSGLSGLQYFDGANWQTYTSGTVNLNSSGKLLVRVAISPEQETALDGPETFNLTATNTGGGTATGVGTIFDDGTGTYYPDTNPTGDTPATSTPTLDDDRPLTVNNIDVNEGSPYAVFTVSGAANQLASLSLADGTTTNMGNNALQYWDATANGGAGNWITYTSGNVALNSSGKLLVRTLMTDEQETAQDNGETFTLTATNTGTSSATGTATIHDDGTGSYFPNNNTGEPYTTSELTSNNITLDYDGPLSINSVDVNEASPYAIFEVTGNANQPATLSLTNGTTSGLSGLQYFDGANWQTYTSGTVNLNSSGKLLVRVAISPEQETALDGPERFTITATNTNSETAIGTGTIHDNGTGDIFLGNNNTANPNNPGDTDPAVGAPDYPTNLDDDRPLSVNDISVNEGSPYAVFTVTGAANQLASLSFADGTTTNTMANNTYEYYNGSTWQTYSAGTFVNLDTNGKLLVRTVMTDEKETALDNGETFTVTATNTGGSSDTGTATIHDDGTGQWFDGTNGTGSNSAPNGSLLDDDRLLSVNDISVNEGSPYGVFTVTGATGQLVKLNLGNTSVDTDVDATLGTDTANAGTSVPLQYYNGSAWVDYVADSYVAIPTGATTLLVRTAITNDTTYENAETFTLTATNTGGTTNVITAGNAGISTIHDNGTGQWFDGSGGTGSTSAPTGSILDDDRPTLTLSDAMMEEGSTIVFAGSLSKASANNEEITLSTSLTTAESNDFNSDKTTWTVTYLNSSNVIQTLSVASSGKFTLPAGITSFNVNIPTTSDSVYEGSETFTLSASATSNYITDTDTAIGTIKDDGTGSDGDDDDVSGDNDITKFSIADAEAYEGASNTITFTVTRIGDAEANQTVNYAATIETGNTAVDGDFTGTLTGTLTFAPGETSKTITLNVPVDADGNIDTFTVTLTNPSTGSTILDGTAIGTIKESNILPEGTDKTIALGKNSTYVLSTSDFGYSDADNDAFAKVKITTLETNGKLLYFNGTSWVDVTENQEITKTAIDNGYLVFKPDSNEVGVPYANFKFLVNDGTAYDDDVNTITYNIGNTLSVSNPLPVDEGKSAIFTISLDEARSSSTLLDLSIGGVASSSDYNTTLYYKKIANDGQSWTWEIATSNQVTIAQGQTSVEIKVKTLIDAVADNAESLTLTATINGGTNTDMANTSAVGSTTINDYPSLVIDTKPYITEGDFAVFEVSLSSPKSTSTVISLGGGGSATWGTDYSQNYEYSIDDGKTWQSISNFSVTIPGSSTTTPSVLIRTQTINDGTSEPDETITLIATTIDSGISTKSVNATTTVVDQINLTVYEKGDDTALSSQANNVTLTSSEYIYTLLGQGKNGTVVQSGNNLIYTPDNDFSGSDSFTYIRTNTTTGLEVVGSATVTVYANADTPIIEIGANVAVIENIVDSNAWYWKAAGGSVGSTEDVSGGGNVNTSSSFLIDKGDFVYQTFASSLSGYFDIAVGYSGGGLTIYGGTLTGTTITGITKLSGSSVISSGSTYSYNLTGYNTIIVGNVNSSVATITSFNTTQTVALNTVVYDVDIYDALTDTNNETTGTTNIEQLQNVTVIVKNSSNAVISSSTLFNQGTYNSSDGSWTFTQAQLSNLKITISTTNATNGVTIEATATSKELSNNSTATNTATISIISSDDRPTIGDKTLAVTNGSVNTTSSTNIDTDYSSNTPNVFSWDVAKTQIPELYADGQKVVITFDNVTGKVTGTIDNGTTTIFTTTINMADNNLTTLNYTQGSELLGVVNMIDGDIVLPGGGNQDYRVFQFTDSNSSSIVDALVYAHNLIEDTPAEIASLVAEHTVNTNNYYIGVDSNNMNAGQQLIFDFATVGTYDTTTTHANEVSEINIKLFNFGSEKSGDELFITVITKDPAHAGQTIRENILLTQDSDYTTELEYTVRSSTGNPIVAVEFLAGNNSSFKLGIESIGSINYNDTFEMKYAYDISDVDGDTDGGLTTIKVGSGTTVNTSLDYELDSKIVFDSSDKIIDGGAGIDTLVLGSNIDIDFSSYANSIQNIEKIDLTNSSATNDLSNIKLQDILNITDSTHLLTILGDGDGAGANADDKVSLKSETNKVWTLASSDTTYNNYANSGDNTVSLKIDKDISVSIIN